MIIDKNGYVHFRLDGCDIALNARAPRDMTVEQLVRQCDSIKLPYCACGLKSSGVEYCNDGSVWPSLEIEFDYDDIKVIDDTYYEVLPKKIELNV